MGERSAPQRRTEVDAVLLVSFGGPEAPEEVLPFLGKVLAGRPVAPARLQEVAAHYLELGGRSPINGQNRALQAAIRCQLAATGSPLPVYWGNRNWHPLLADTLRRMRDDGVRRAAAFVTSAFASYSGCRHYQDDIEAARAEVGAGAPEVRKLRPFFNHPGFVEPLADAVRAARADAGLGAPVLMTAHSIPVAQAATCDYEPQLRETARLVAERCGEPLPRWSLVYQSRSGPPGMPWLEPDVTDAIRGLPAGTPTVVVAPIGFVSDHMEVVYDLDRQAAAVAAERGVRMVRAATPGLDPRFVSMVGELVGEITDRASRRALGRMAPAPWPCPAGCCPSPSRGVRP